MSTADISDYCRLVVVLVWSRIIILLLIYKPVVALLRSVWAGCGKISYSDQNQNNLLIKMKTSSECSMYTKPDDVYGILLHYSLRGDQYHIPPLPQLTMAVDMSGVACTEIVGFTG